MNEEKNQQLTEAELDGVTGGLVGLIVKAVLGTITNVVGAAVDAGVFSSISDVVRASMK